MLDRTNKIIVHSLDVIRKLIVDLKLQAYQFHIVRHAAMINWRQQHTDCYAKLRNVASAIQFGNHTMIPVTSEDLLHPNRVKELSTQEKPLLSLTSLVKSPDDKVYHLPMMNLHLDYPVSITILNRALQSLIDKDYYLMSTDRYYHVFATDLLTESEWKLWNLKFLMVDAIVSPRYIGHSLERGYNVLRFNATDSIKTKTPRLVNNGCAGDEYTVVQESKKFAVIKHGAQVRKNGELYFHHLFEVEKISTELAKHLGFSSSEINQIQQAAILHDCIEDTETDYEDILAMTDRQVADMVALLSNDKRKPKSERDREFLNQIKAAPLSVQLIKLADIYSNLSSIHQASTEGKTMNNNYVLKAERFLCELDRRLHSTSTFEKCKSMIGKTTAAA